MYYYQDEKLNYMDIIKISIILTLFIVLLVANYHIAVIICDIGNISFDLMISAMSIGFGYELTIVPTCIEIGIIGYYISKLMNFVEK